MGHHINDKGEFQSDKHPDLPPDRLRVNITNPRSTRALLILADDYQGHDAEFADDLRNRVLALLNGRRFYDEQGHRWTVLTTGRPTNGFLAEQVATIRSEPSVLLGKLKSQWSSDLTVTRLIEWLGTVAFERPDEDDDLL